MKYEDEMQIYIRRIRELEADTERLKGFERRAQGLSIQLEEEKRKAAEGRREVQDEKEDRKIDDTLAKELRSEVCNV